MTPVVSLLLLTSMSLIAAGFGLLFTARHDELRELSPAELSTSAPVVRSCWARIHERICAQSRRGRHPRPRSLRRSPAMLQAAERSASRATFAGRVSQLGSDKPG